MRQRCTDFYSQPKDVQCGEGNISENKESLLRLFKSVLCYSRAVGLFCLSRNQVRSEDRLSGSVNCYYCIFHLGVASLCLTPNYEFDVLREFMSLDLDEIQRAKRPRVTQLGHNAMRKRLLELGKDHEYLGSIGKFLEESVELRENYSYGPWIQIDSIEIGDETIRMPSRPIFLRRDLQITKDKPRAFSPLKDLTDPLISRAEGLLDKYHTILTPWISECRGTFRRDAFSPLVKTVLANTLVEAPFFFAQLVPKPTFEETKSRLLSFLDNLGRDYEDVARSVASYWNDPKYAEALESGSIIHIDMKLERKTSSKNICAFCGSDFEAQLTKCPKCGRSGTLRPGEFWGNLWNGAAAGTQLSRTELILFVFDRELSRNINKGQLVEVLTNTVSTATVSLHREEPRLITRSPIILIRQVFYHRGRRASSSGTAYVTYWKCNRITVKTIQRKVKE